MVANKKKTTLRSAPARKKKTDLDAFAAAAGSSRTETDTVYPWEEPHVRDDVMKNLPIRLPEPLYLKLKFIADNSPYSMNSFIIERIIPEIEKEIAELTGGKRRG
ncbi:hypothetical protein [Desulfolithobacter sp.]